MIPHSWSTGQFETAVKRLVDEDCRNGPDWSFGDAITGIYPGD